LMMIGRIFYADFGLFYQVPMDSGSLYDYTNVIDTYVYRALMQIGDIGMSSAAGVYQSVVGFILVLGANLVIKKINPESALF
jgi:putative aldouronate transport system permease protein